jgi:hypothetical protein
MNVFLSWSGEPSRLVAEALHDWLPLVIQSLNPWMSKRDIAKGARWSDEIKANLNAGTAGIVCVTPGNMEHAWLLFEAGALAKTLERPMVCTYLHGVTQGELRPPLAEFQATLATHDETKQLMETLNKALGDVALSEKRLSDTFDKFWPDLEHKLAAIDLGPADAAPKRSTRDLTEEILGLVREAGRDQTPPEMIPALVEVGIDRYMRRHPEQLYSLATLGGMLTAQEPGPLPLRHQVSRVMTFDAASGRLTGDEPAQSASVSPPSALQPSPPIGGKH